SMLGKNVQLLILDVKTEPRLAEQRQGLAGDDERAGGNACLLVRVEIQQAGDAAGALPRQDGVLFAAHLQRQKGSDRHGWSILDQVRRASCTPITYTIVEIEDRANFRNSVLPGKSKR